jgi:hypothetical protein
VAPLLNGLGIDVVGFAARQDRQGGRRQVEPATAVPSSMVSCSPLPAGALTRRLCFFVVGSGSGACSSDPAVPAAGDGSGVASEADGGTRIGDSWCTTTCGPSEPGAFNRLCTQFRSARPSGTIPASTARPRLARHHHDATCCLTSRGASNDSKGNESGTDKDKYRSEGLDGGIKATSHSQAQEASTGTQAVGSV